MDPVHLASDDLEVVSLLQQSVIAMLEYLGRLKYCCFSYT